MSAHPLGGAMVLNPTIEVWLKQMWAKGKHRQVYPRGRQLKECKLSQRGIRVGIWEGETDEERREIKRGKESDTYGWYLGSALGWAPVCGRAAWILLWCLSCTPALSHCNENKHTFTAIICCLFEELNAATVRGTYGRNHTSKLHLYALDYSEHDCVLDCTLIWTRTCMHVSLSLNQQHNIKIFFCYVGDCNWLITEA